MKKLFGQTALVSLLALNLLALVGCGGPTIDKNASQTNVMPQEEDPAAYEKEQAALLKKTPR